MKTILFINGGKVTDQSLSDRFRLRIEWAIEYYINRATNEDVIFFVSGRWDNVTENYFRTESEVAKEFILTKIPDAQVIKEELSVELIGNYAFSKPLLAHLRADNIKIVTSENLRNRTLAICKKVFGESLPYEFIFLADEWTGNPALVDKEANALQLFENLCGQVANGDDAAIREILLYKTPYYFKGVIDDKNYFDTYWPGGYEHFLRGVAVRNKM